MAAEEKSEIKRVDKYNISIAGKIVCATEEQETKIRELTPIQLEKFKKTMGI